MNAIELMVQEHIYIKRMLKVVRNACAKLLDESSIEVTDFDLMIDFIRNYADKHHHGKEEAFLFKQMETQLGEIGMKLIRTGMLIEHDLGRLYIQQLEEAIEKYQKGDKESKLDIIANAIGYTHLLNRHIDKEDQVVYVYGARHLEESIMDDINEQSAAFEAEASKEGVQQKYMQVLELLEAKYA